MGNDSSSLTSYGLYAVLFLSTAYISMAIMPLSNFLLGSGGFQIILPALIPLAIGVVTADIFSGKELLRTGLVGSILVAISSALGELTQRGLEILGQMISDIYTGTPSETMQETGASGLIGNLDSAGVNPIAVFAIAFIGLNIPIIYSFLQETGEAKKTHLLLYAFPPVIAVGTLYMLRLLMAL